MPRTDIEFKTSDNVTLRGWFFKPTTTITSKLPCLILQHGFSCVKEMALGDIAEKLVSDLPITCLVYDHRGFGSSDTLPGVPRLEVIPTQQIHDLRDAITYAQGREEVNKDKIALWGYSYSGGHALYAAAVDRRVKAVIALVPLMDGFENANRLVPAHTMADLRVMFEADRLSRAAGNPPAMLPVVSNDPAVPCAMPSKQALEFWSPWDREDSPWKNELTLRSLDEIPGYTLPISALDKIAPTPVFFVAATRDTNGPPDMILRQYGQISEPKELLIVDNNHFEVPTNETVYERQVAFLKRTVCA